jgi:hypothetical protein
MKLLELADAGVDGRVDRADGPRVAHFVRLLRLRRATVDSDARSQTGGGVWVGVTQRTLCERAEQLRSEQLRDREG